MALFQKDNLQKHFGWAVIASELSHVFCCVIPTLVTVLSVFANFGLFVMSPDGWLVNIHNVMHHYEIPIILFSGGMVALGWVAHLISRRVDCHDTGCGHPPCAPQKTNNSRILTIATILFLMNIVIYFGVHRNILQIDTLSSDSLEQHFDHEHESEQH